ncbi:putative carbonic anhydrase 2 [Fusarium austroafricanum]|uniref:Putative carbonic anhydrase 2 n=1 Tax=Fusarium austroafricanum TaxID=2364996 RepID=A0A8H4NX75_9HYPO|nr:putative carbonic anhydrase 2 [Fusarium austroafricanum]
MLALYQKRRSVEYRPGLELEKCQCRRDNSEYSYDWRHIYECYRAAATKVDGFAELCFLCNEWFRGIEAWETHCQHHLDHPDSLPTWCDPLVYGGVLARAGYCPFCLGDDRMKASARMHQFKQRWAWLDHIQTHIRTLDNTNLSCPRQHTHCPGHFDSVLDLQFHLQDAFGVERSDDTRKMKRPRYEVDNTPPSKRKKVPQSRNSLEESDRTPAGKTQYTFHHTDPESMKRQSSPQSSRLSQESTPFFSSVATDFEGTAPSVTTPPSSMTPETSETPESVIDPAMGVGGMWPNEGLTGGIVTSGPPETTLEISQENQDLYDKASVTPDFTRKCGATNPANFLDLDVSFRQQPPTPIDELFECDTDNNQERIGGVPSQDSQDKECHDRPLPLDEEGTEFEVETLLAKGRIGRRVWYKVKWKGYPESDSSWVRKKDIGTGAIATYEARHSHEQGTFKLERLVSKKKVNGITLYEVKWQGQLESENIWVDKWDLGAKVVSAFEANPSM